MRNLRIGLKRFTFNRLRRFRVATGAPAHAEVSGKGTFEDFLTKLLAVESGIDPAKFDMYVREYESPVIPYPRVTAPGRVIRDASTGGYAFEMMSVANYFRTLGVDHLFDPSSPGCIRAMQYASTNVLGFIGYQFGEVALIRGGYYRPVAVLHRQHGRSQKHDSYYIGSLKDTTWRGGRTQVLHRLCGTRKVVLATDVNRWAGAFTCKNGICGIEDLKEPHRQELLMRDNLDANYATIQAIFRKNRYDFRTAPFTWSGLLAAAHLCGPDAAAAFVLRGAIATDEFKTDIRTYVHAFGGFDTPYRP